MNTAPITRTDGTNIFRSFSTDETQPNRMILAAHELCEPDHELYVAVVTKGTKGFEFSVADGEFNEKVEQQSPATMQQFESDFREIVALMKKHPEMSIDEFINNFLFNKMATIFEL